MVSLNKIFYIYIKKRSGPLISFTSHYHKLYFGDQMLSLACRCGGGGDGGPKEGGLCQNVP
jgi:hypothetical protein